MADPNVNTMPEEAYRAYLSSENWKDYRERKLGHRKWVRCSVCLHLFAKARIELHHKTYEHVGEELMTDTVPVCKGCHELVDKIAKANFDSAIYVARNVKLLVRLNRRTTRISAIMLSIAVLVGLFALFSLIGWLNVSF